jgi:hypothetical protein
MATAGSGHWVTLMSFQLVGHWVERGQAVSSKPVGLHTSKAPQLRVSGLSWSEQKKPLAALTHVPTSCLP